VASDAGTVQGAPLAGFLACFSLLACTRAAKASLRTSVAALPADDVQGRRAMASGMADDTTLVARPQHLVTGGTGSENEDSCPRPVSESRFLISICAMAVFEQFLLYSTVASSQHLHFFTVRSQAALAVKFV
jgi:hypothetical protein